MSCVSAIALTQTPFVAKVNEERWTGFRTPTLQNSPTDGDLMYTVEVTLRGTPLSMAVQRKELSDAETLYRSIFDAIQSTTPKLLELTCEKEVDKKIGILVSEITGVQMSEKGGGPSKGGFTGFGV